MKNKIVDFFDGRQRRKEQTEQVNPVCQNSRDHSRTELLRNENLEEYLLDDQKYFQELMLLD